jgi:hypothetical protein
MLPRYSRLEESAGLLVELAEFWDEAQQSLKSLEQYGDQAQTVLVSVIW